MFKSRYYLSADAISQAFRSEKGIETFSYDKDFDIYDDAIILPEKILRGVDGEIRKAGGVCDKYFNFLAGYSSSGNPNDKYGLEFNYSYKVNELDKSSETVIFSGFLINHFGHFMQDSLSRMWYAAKDKDKRYKIAVLLYGNDTAWKDWSLDGSFQEQMLELLGIEKERLLIIKNPTQFSSVVVPKQSVFWRGRRYNTDLIKVVYEKAKQSISPKNHKKIYLSRTAWKTPVINESYFEEFFSAKGFKVIHPEELTLKEQIACIAGADEIACTYGTLTHLAIFANPGTKLIGLFRNHALTELARQQVTDHANQIDSVYIDTAFNIFPTIHSSRCNMMAPTTFWSEFLKKEYGIKEDSNIFDYLNSSNIALGDYSKLYLEALCRQNFFGSVYTLKFNPIPYLKSLYSAIDPSSLNTMLRFVRMTDNTLFRGKIFIYERPDKNIKCKVKLLASGSIWPIDNNSLAGETLWTYLRGRLYFLNGGYQIVSEFVTEGIITKKQHAKYMGVIQSRVTDTCSLETHQPGAARNWIIRHAIKFLVNKKRYRKLKHSPGKFFKDSKNSLIRYLGRYYVRGNSTVVFYWRRQFNEYFNSHDITAKVENLKLGMDETSVRYIENFIKLSKYWYRSTFVGSQRPEHELIKLKAYKKFKETFEQPFSEILQINPYYFFDIYGLADLPPEVLSSIDGKVIIDGGGLNGDTALVFNRHFPNSDIHVYEPLEYYIDIINRFLAVDNCNNRIKPVNKGLGDAITKQFMRFGAGANIADITTIDNEYNNTDTNIGLIKLDTEGAETSIIRGAEKVISRDKPVLAIAIYHRPEDFFELKDRIKALNPAYRFMIRKSEPSLPQADLLLIAY